MASRRKFNLPSTTFWKNVYGERWFWNSWNGVKKKKIDLRFLWIVTWFFFWSEEYHRYVEHALCSQMPWLWTQHTAGCRCNTRYQRDGDCFTVPLFDFNYFQVVTLPEAKLLLKEDDDLIIAVYDYWLNKRLRLVSICILSKWIGGLNV